VFEAGTGLLDLSANGVGQPIIGPDNQPLRGVNKLGTNRAADVREVNRLAKENAKLRDDFQAIGTQILGTETRLLKMGVIRDAVQAELFHLASFEVNVYETRETVLRRKRQLMDRLAAMGQSREHSLRHRGRSNTGLFDGEMSNDLAGQNPHHRDIRGRPRLGVLHRPELRSADELEGRARQVQGRVR
jgi:hypothetical protein